MLRLGIDESEVKPVSTTPSLSPMASSHSVGVSGSLSWTRAAPVANTTASASHTAARQCMRDAARRWGISTASIQGRNSISESTTSASQIPLYAQGSLAQQMSVELQRELKQVKFNLAATTEAEIGI